MQTKIAVGSKLHNNVRPATAADVGLTSPSTALAAPDVPAAAEPKAPWATAQGLPLLPGPQTFAALRAPAGMYISMQGVNDARRHVSSLRQRLNEATRARRQAEVDLRDLGRALRRMPDDDSTTEVSWTDAQGARQERVSLSQGEAGQLEVTLENLQMEKDDEVQQLRDAVESAQQNLTDAQNDVSQQMQLRSNLMQARHDTSMSIIRNIGR